MFPALPSFVTNTRQNLYFCSASSISMPASHQQEVMDDAQLLKMRLLWIANRGRTEMGAGKDF
jgi:hypothetical protein